MRHLATLLLASSALALAPAAPAAAQQAWGVAPTDVTPDPAIRYGTLDNGMKYAIMPNDYRPGQAAVRMHYDFGSLLEDEDERGLAHFIEHMAFNGTTNVAEGEMIDMLERLGLAFGADTNASTGFDETIYMLDLPQVDAERLDAAFFLMRETASEVQFDPEAVDRERGVILGERRVRNTWQLRNAEDALGFFLPQAPYATQLPIGTEEVLTTAPADRMKALYHRYYRPEKATFIFVGDVDPDEIEQRIRDAFGDWQGVGEAGTGFDRGTIDLARDTAIDTFVDPASVSSVTIRYYRPHEDPADTLAQRRDNLLDGITTALFNKRLERIANQPDSVLLGGGVSEGREKDLALQTTLSATVRDGEWQAGIATLDQEMRRALDHGFTQRELDLVKREGIQRWRTYAEQAENRTHGQLANALVAAVGEDVFVTTPDYQRGLYEAAAEAITLDEVDARFAELFDAGDPLIRVMGKEEISDAQILAALQASQAVAVAAPTQAQSATFAYADWGAPGTIVADSMIEDLGIRTLQFTNGVRLNLKTTDFQDNRVSWNVSVDGGGLLLGGDAFGPTLYAQLASSLGGTGEHGFQEIDEHIAGRPIGTGFTVDESAVAAGGSLAPEFLRAQLEVAAAYLTDFGYRAEADARWATIAPLIFSQLKATPAAVYSTQSSGVLTGGDPRFSLPAEDSLAAFDAAALRGALDDMLDDNAITVSVVGDMDQRAVIDAVAATFGALDRRAAPITDYDLEPVTLAAPGEIELVHDGEADQALIAAYWPTDDDADFELEVGLSLLRTVMDLELTDKIREELGASYGVQVSATQSVWHDGFGNISAVSVVDPERMDETLAAYREVAASLRNAPVDADLLQRARAPMIEQRTDAKRSNAYWLGYAILAQRFPDRLDRARRYDEVLASLTPQDLQALAQRYLTDEALRPVRVVSSKLGAEGAK